MSEVLAVPSPASAGVGSIAGTPALGYLGVPEPAPAISSYLRRLRFIIGR